jgi:hypothetical protein
MNDADDRPLAILVLWALAGVNAIFGMWCLVEYMGADTKSADGLIMQAQMVLRMLSAFAGAAGLWVGSVVIDLLWKIERNTRGRR